jgi:hypothetical protein
MTIGRSGFAILNRAINPFVSWLVPRPSSGPGRTRTSDRRIMSGAKTGPEGPILPEIAPLRRRSSA